MEWKGCFGAFLFPNVSPQVWARLTEPCVTFQIAVWDCLLTFTQNGLMVSLHVLRIVPFLLSFFFFKKGWSSIWWYLTISIYKSLVIPLYVPAFRNVKVFCLLVMVCWLKIDIFTLFHWNSATQFLGGNSSRHSLGILHTWDIVYYQQYSVHNFKLVLMRILILKIIYYFEVGPLKYIISYFCWGGGG